MNGQSECTRARVIDTDPAGSMRNAAPAGTFERGDGERVDRRRVWRPWRLRSDQVAAANRRSSEFLAVFSHELRNSLGAIRAAASVLRTDTSADPVMVKARLLIERQAGQMTRLVEDVLDASRIRRGQLRLQRERIDLCEVVSRALHTVEFVMQQRNHRVSTSFPGDPTWLQADSTRLEQVFVNLLVNAGKYTDVGGEVEVSVRREADEAIVRVRDTGIGIAPDVLPHVFDLFVQADPSSRYPDAGLGIGLALVRSLVECHGGRVTAASGGLGQGSEFTVQLPMPAE